MEVAPDAVAHDGVDRLREGGSRAIQRGYMWARINVVDVRRVATPAPLIARAPEQTRRGGHTDRMTPVYRGPKGV